MIVYNYDNEGLFAGPSVPPIDPMQEGKFLKPMNSTEVAPPTGYAVEQIPKFDPDTETWSLVDSPYKIAQDKELAFQENEQALQAAEAARELNVQKLQEKREGIHTHYEGEDGSAVAKTEEEISAEIQAKWDYEALQDLKITTNSNILNKAKEITKASTSESAQAFISAYTLRANNPAEYVADDLVVHYATTGYALGDALDTEQKIVEYYTKIMIEMDKFRNAEIATYLAAKAAL